MRKEMLLILVVAWLFLSPIEARGEWEVHVNSNWVTDVWADSANVYWGSENGAVVYNPPTGAHTKLLKSIGGLASNHISSILRDESGRLWLGTANQGLSVLSSAGTWRSYNTGTLQLLSDQVQDISSYSYLASMPLESRTAVGTSEGISLFENGEFRTFFSAMDWSGSGCNSAEAVAVGGDWMLVGTECGCYAYSFSLLMWTALLPDRATMSIDYDGRETFWIVTADSIYTYGPDGLEWISKQFIRPDLVYDISAEDSVVWVATSNGPAWYDFQEAFWTRETDGLTRPLYDAGSIYVTDGGVAWIGTEIGAAVLESGAWVIYASDGPAGNYVQDIQVDRDGKVWFATGSRWSGPRDINIGILIYDGLEWEQITKDPLMSGIAYCLDASPVDGSMYVGFWGGGLMRGDLETGAWDTLNTDLEIKVISEVFVDERGRVFLGEYTRSMGLLCPDDSLVHYSPEDTPACVETKCVTAIGPGPNGPMIGSYLSPTEGCLDLVVELDVGDDCADKSDDQCRIWSSEDGYSEGYAYDFARDIYGVTWLGTSGGLSSFENRWNVVNTAFGDVWDIETDSYGAKWVGTNQGLYVLEGYGTEWSHFSDHVRKYDSTNSPLDDSPIKALAFDADGALWIGTGGGGIFKLSDPHVEPARRWVDVFPNPYYSWEDWEGKGIRFTGFLPGRRIRIYTVAGDLVAEIDPEEAWHGRNMNGDDVVSGVYVYHAYAQDGREFTGKIAIVR